MTKQLPIESPEGQDLIAAANDGSIWRKEFILMTRELAEQIIENLVQLVGYGFHVDTPVSEYVNHKGQPTFYRASAAEYQAQLDEACRVLEEAKIDPSEVAGRLIDENFVSDESRSYGPRR